MRQLETMHRLGYVSGREAADLLGLSLPRIYQMVAEQKLASRRIGRAWYVELATVVTYLRSGSPAAPDEMIGRAEHFLDAAPVESNAAEGAR